MLVLTRLYFYQGGQDINKPLAQLGQALQYSTPDEVYASASGALIVDKFPRPLVKPAHKPKPEQRRPAASQTECSLNGVKNCLDLGVHFSDRRPRPQSG